MLQKLILLELSNISVRISHSGIIYDRYIVYAENSVMQPQNDNLYERKV